MHSKEDLEDLCGDLFAIRVIAQSTGVPSTVRKQLRGSLKALLYKSSRYQETEATVANKKPKLEETTTKTSTKKGNEVTEDIDKQTNVEEREQKKIICEKEKEAVIESMVITENNNEKTNADKEITRVKTEIKEEIVCTKENDKEKEKEAKVVKKRENTPSTASEDETETQKAIYTMESDEEDNNGLLTACGPVVAASTVAEKKKQQQQQQKETKNEPESSSDEGANSIYTIHKNSSSTTTSVTGKGGERLTVTLAKNANKKTANERQVAEHDKRCKMLHTMETYIRSILALMQKDEEQHSNNNEQSGDTENEERITVTIPAVTTLVRSDVGIMSDTESSDENPTLGLPKSPSATPPPLAPLSRRDCNITIAKVTSTATMSKTRNILMSMDDEDDDDEEESEKQSDLNKSSSSTSSSLLANGDEDNGRVTKSNVTPITTQNVELKRDVNKKDIIEAATTTASIGADIRSSPASPTDILTTVNVDPTQL